MLEIICALLYGIAKTKHAPKLGGGGFWCMEERSPSCRWHSQMILGWKGGGSSAKGSYGKIETSSAEVSVAMNHCLC